jgi:hypothetical protein
MIAFSYTYKNQYSMTLYDPLSDYESNGAKTHTKKSSILTGVKMFLAYLCVS